MTTFKSFLKQEKLTHLEHLEDLVWKSPQGVQKAIRMLDDIRQKMIGLKENVNISVKWDGSPSIVFGNDGNFYVGTKSVLNKTKPIKCYTETDVIKHYGDKQSKGLVEILTYCIRYLPEINIKEGKMYQGDFLFIDKTLKEQKINGLDYVTFQPNTIIYGLQKEKSISNVIKGMKLGIVVHTEYVNSEARPYKSNELKTFTKNVFCYDSYYAHDSIIAEGFAFSNMNFYLNTLNKMVDTGVLEHISKSKLSEYIIQCNNWCIREGKEIDFLIIRDYVYGKCPINPTPYKIKQFQEYVNFLDKNKKAILEILELTSTIKQYKMSLLNQLNKAHLTHFSTFVEENGNLIPSEQEGYVVYNPLGEAVKLVNREEFSKRNFDKND